MKKGTQNPFRYDGNFDISSFINGIHSRNDARKKTHIPHVLSHGARMALALVGYHYSDDWDSEKAAVVHEDTYNVSHQPLIKQIVADPKIAKEILSREDTTLRDKVRTLIDSKGVPLEAISNIALVSPQWLESWLAHPEPGHLHGALPIFHFSKGCLNSLRLFLACCLFDTNLQIADKYSNSADVAIAASRAASRFANYSENIAISIFEIAKKSDAFGNVTWGYDYFFSYVTEKVAESRNAKISGNGKLGALKGIITPISILNQIAYLSLFEISDTHALSFNTIPPHDKKSKKLDVIKLTCVAWHPDKFELAKLTQQYFRDLCLHENEPGPDIIDTATVQKLVYKGWLLPQGLSPGRLITRLAKIERELLKEPDGDELIRVFYNLANTSREAALESIQLPCEPHHRDHLADLAQIIELCYSFESGTEHERKAVDAIAQRYSIQDKSKLANLSYQELLRAAARPFKNQHGETVLWPPATTFNNPEAKENAIAAFHRLQKHRPIHPLLMNDEKCALPVRRHIAALPAGRPGVFNWPLPSGDVFDRGWTPPAQLALPQHSVVPVEAPEPPPQESAPLPHAPDVDLESLIYEELLRLSREAEDMLRELGRLPVMVRHQILSGQNNDNVPIDIRRVLTVPADETRGGTRLRELTRQILRPGEDGEVRNLDEDGLQQTREELIGNTARQNELLDLLSHVDTVLKQVRRQLDSGMPRPLRVTIVEFSATAAAAVPQPAPRPRKEGAPDPGAFGDDIAYLDGEFKKRDVKAKAVNEELARRHGDQTWTTGLVSNLFNNPHRATQQTVDQMLQILLDFDDKVLVQKLESGIHTLRPGPNFWLSQHTQQGGVMLSTGDYYAMDLVFGTDGKPQVILRRPGGETHVVRPNVITGISPNP